MGNEDGRWGTAFGKICTSEDCLPSPFTLDTSTSGMASYAANTITVTGDGDVTSTGDLTLKGMSIGFQNSFSVATNGLLSVYNGVCP
jgi:hypothetical protein